MAIAFSSSGSSAAAHSDVADVSANLVRTQDRIGDMQDQIDRLLLITESMWFVLKDKLKLDDAALMAMMKEVDMKDGKLDGKATAKPEPCVKCGHLVSVRTGVCLYCGTKSERKSPF